MNVSAIKRILKDDLARLGTLPTWMDAFLTPINQFIDVTGSALKNSLTFKDNFAAKEITLSFTHATAQKINPQSSQKVKGILVIDSGGQILTGQGFTRNQDGTISVTLNFLAAGTTKATCVVEILLG